jgi:hypothetical protein
MFFHANEKNESSVTPWPDTSRVRAVTCCGKQLTRALKSSTEEPSRRSFFPTRLPRRSAIRLRGITSGNFAVMGSPRRRSAVANPSHGASTSSERRTSEFSSPAQSGAGKQTRADLGTYLAPSVRHPAWEGG